MLIRTILITTFALAIIGCNGNGDEVEQAFVDADTFTFYTVEPEGPIGDDDDREAVYGYAVLGKVAVTDKADRRKLLAAMQRGIDENDDTAAGCFNPRHAIDIRHGDERITYVICFECLQIAIHYGSGERGSELTSEGPAPVFNGFARAAGLKIAD